MPDQLPRDLHPSLLSALFGDGSLEEALPASSENLGSERPSTDSFGRLSTEGNVAIDLEESLPAVFSSSQSSPELQSDSEGTSLFWLDGDADLLSLDEGDLLIDPLAEVDAVLHQAGISSGTDFRDVLQHLPANFRSRRLLCRCLPGLATSWDRFRHVISDALHRIGEELVPDPELSLLPLIEDAEHLPATIPPSVTEPLQLYLHELTFVRLLTHDEHRLLGQWVADGHLLSTTLGPSYAPLKDKMTTDELLDRLLADLAQCWNTVGTALQSQPCSAAAWRAALVTLGVRGVDDEHLDRVAMALGVDGDRVRAELRRIETTLRVLPDETVAWLAECLSATGRPPQKCTGRGIDEFGRDQSQLVERAPTAKRVMIRHSLRLVTAVARSYAGSTRSLEFTDLVQEGVLGLIHAIDKWEPNRGYALSTYATWWIKQSITRAIADKDLTIRLPVHIVERVQTALNSESLLSTASEEFRNDGQDEHGQRAVPIKPPRAREERYDLLCKAGIAPDLSARLAGIIELQPLDAAEIQADALADGLGAVEEAVDQALLAETVMEVLGTLKPRERQILELRFGLEGGDERTLESVGQELGVTRERIRQIEAKAIKRLRHPSRSRRLRPFFDDARAGDSRNGSAATSPEHDEEYRRAVEQLMQRMTDLPQEEQLVLKLRLGLAGNKPWSYAAIATRLRIPVAYVRGYEANAVSHVGELVEMRNGSVSLTVQ